MDRHSVRRRLIVGVSMAATVKVASHQTPHQNHHHQKKIEISVQNSERPAQRADDENGGNNP
jgi:hypothetical protein